MVTCVMYQACFEATSIANMNNCLNGGTHGPVHIKVGGEWNDPEEQLTVDLGLYRCPGRGGGIRLLRLVYFCQWLV